MADKDIVEEELQKHNELIKDYCYGREEKERTWKSFEHLLEYLENRLVDYGYGETTFHTADIQALIYVIKAINSTKESYKQKVLEMIKELKNKIMPNQKIINWSQFQIIDLIEEELTKRIEEMK